MKLKEIARELRNNPTDAERYMWNFLRVNFRQFNFFRQKPLDNFIVDFYCPDKNLIIEIDGGIHSMQKERDSERDNIFIQNFNLKTIRFTNEQVFSESDYLKKLLSQYLS